MAFRESSVQIYLTGYSISTWAPDPPGRCTKLGSSEEANLMDPRDHNHNRDHGHHAHDHGSAHRTHRFHPSQLDRLTSAERHAELPPLASLSAAGVVGGMTVIDLGCGPGFFAIPAAGIVGPGGHVYGVDVQAGMIEHLRTEIDRRQIPNISVLLSTESRVDLPDETADIVFIAVVLHEVDDPVAFLSEAGRLVKRDGAIAIIEFHKRDDLVDGPPMAHRVSVGELTDLATLAGMKVGSTTDLTDRIYLTKLTRGIV